MSLFDLCVWVALIYCFVLWPIKTILGLFTKDPDLEKKVRRDEYIRKRIDEAAPWGPSSRWRAHLWTKYGAEYDAIVREAQKDALKASQHPG
jgi:hypothetical protein